MAIAFTAGGTIYPSRLVYVPSSSSLTTAGTVIQATAATNQVIGVSGVYQDSPPGLNPIAATINGVSTVTGAAAVTGEVVWVYQVGDRCLVEIGSNSVSVGDPITADANGRGVTASGSNFYAGIALEPATASQTFIRMAVLPGQL